MAEFKNPDPARLQILYRRRVVSCAVMLVSYTGLLFLWPFPIEPVNTSLQIVLVMVVVVLAASTFKWFYRSWKATANVPASEQMFFSSLMFISSLVTTNIIMFAILYRMMGIIDTGDSSVTHDPGSSLYFSIVTWTTLGYGDFKPTPEARPIAALEAMFGYITMVVAISYLGLSLPKAKQG